MHRPVSSRGATAIAQGERSSAHPTIPARQLQRGVPFRGCSHSLMFRPLHSLGPPAAPTAEFPPGRPGRLHRAEPGWLPAPGSGIATCPSRAIGMAGLSPAEMQPCRLLLLPLNMPALAGRTPFPKPHPPRQACVSMRPTQHTPATRVPPDHSFCVNAELTVVICRHSLRVFLLTLPIAQQIGSKPVPLCFGFILVRGAQDD